MTRNLSPTELKRLHREWRRRTDARLALIIEGVQGPFNVGAIIRTAAAERVDRIWFTAGATTPDNPRVDKTALGTDRLVPWEAVDRTEQAIAAATESGFGVIAIELAQGARPLHELDLTGDTCLVLGHEDRGLSAAASGGAGRIGFIPQLGKVGSLNVASAASIAIYEARRQHWTP